MELPKEIELRLSELSEERFNEDRKFWLKSFKKYPELLKLPRYQKFLKRYNELNTEERLEYIKLTELTRIDIEETITRRADRERSG